MRYNIIPQQIPQERREEINAKILWSIDEYDRRRAEGADIADAAGITGRQHGEEDVADNVRGSTEPLVVSGHAAAGSVGTDNIVASTVPVAAVSLPCSESAPDANAAKTMKPDGTTVSVPDAAATHAANIGTDNASATAAPAPAATEPFVPRETVFNCYTGLGGLHGLDRNDFDNYHDYAEAKREAELGQFFTPHELCRQMVELVAPEPTETVLDLCCGAGGFFNHMPNLHNAYGCDLDPDAVKVAKHLYPEANISVCDIQQYDPGVRFDLIIGNPPFNLRFDGELSQLYYMTRAARLLNPAGLLMVIVPASVQGDMKRTSLRVTCGVELVACGFLAHLDKLHTF
jgi:hypothetical protein